MPNAISHDAGLTGKDYQVLSSYKTRVLNDNGKTSVFYHQTPVVSFDKQSIFLNTGGWWTRTTKARINQASLEFQLGFRVFQKKGGWFVEYKNETHPFVDNELVLHREDKTQEGGEKNGN